MPIGVELSRHMWSYAYRRGAALLTGAGVRAVLLPSSARLQISPEYAARHCFAAPPLAYPTPTTVCACAISCLATGLTEGLGARLYVAGWTHEETIESLVRKAGFNGVLTIKLKQSIKVTRYQSSLCTMRYEQYLVAVGGRAA